MPKITEFHLQRALCMWLDGTSTQPSMLCPDIIYFHTPNGGARGKLEAKRFKEMGVKSGIFDLTFLGRSTFWVLELKDEVGKLSDVQLEMWKRYQAAGAAGIAWANNLAGAKAQIVTWGLVVNSLLTVNAR